MLDRQCLSREHDELIALTTALVAQVTRAAPDLAGLSTVRWRFNRVLLMHLAKEDKLLYPQLTRSPSPTTARLAELFAAEVCGLAADYAAYMQRWPVERIEGEWPAFAKDTRRILDALGKRIAREENELYPCIDAVSTAGTAPARPSAPTPAPHRL
ncbi:hemerythrin domain-containing protein [Sphingomonas sp. Leaf17]|uniref:hemerythrin domain-containing protein n=1 Tax=Sphingomonas sp. Leaf17 TaxID=1735683 RepID=UPI001F3EAB28|nr:hemerythrin domain-containing protein [Sphingomonas sp. Leaf17]